jgi:hypothetical protein
VDRERLKADEAGVVEEFTTAMMENVALTETAARGDG